MRSGWTYIAPLNAAIGVVSPSGPTSIAIPRGGRPLVIASATPAARSRATASHAPAVSRLSRVTSVPSTSATSSRIRLIMFPSRPRHGLCFSW